MSRKSFLGSGLARLVLTGTLVGGTLACSGGDDGGARVPESAPSGTEAGDPGDSSGGQITLLTNRLVVGARGAQIANSATGTITPENGGRISVTADNGTTITLLVPKLTVAKPITVTVTPTSNLVVAGKPRPTIGSVVITPPVALPEEAVLQFEPDASIQLDDWELLIPIGFGETDQSAGILPGLEDLPPVVEDDAGDAGADDSLFGLCPQPFNVYTDPSGVTWTKSPTGPPWWTSDDGRVAYAQTVLPDIFQTCPRPPCPSLGDPAGPGQVYVDQSGQWWMPAQSEGTVGDVDWALVNIVDIAEATFELTSTLMKLTDVPGFNDECGVMNAVTDASGAVVPPTEGDGGVIEIPIDGLNGAGLVGVDEEGAAEIFGNGTDPDYAALNALGLLATTEWNGERGGGTGDSVPDTVPGYGSEQELLEETLPADAGSPGGSWTEGLSDYEIARAIEWLIRLRAYLTDQGIDPGFVVDPATEEAAGAVIEAFVGWYMTDLEWIETVEFSDGDCIDDDVDGWCDAYDGDLVDPADDADGDGIPNSDDDDDDGDGIADADDETPYGEFAYYLDWYFDDAPEDQPMGDVDGDGLIDYFQLVDVDGDDVFDCYVYYSYGEDGYFEHGGNCVYFDLVLSCGDYCDDPSLVDLDLDGYGQYDDCDDTDADVYPGAFEEPNGADDDCNGVVDDQSDGSDDTSPDDQGVTTDAPMDEGDSGDPGDPAADDPANDDPAPDDTESGDPGS